MDDLLEIRGVANPVVSQPKGNWDTFEGSEEPKADQGSNRKDSPIVQLKVDVGTQGEKRDLLARIMSPRH